MKYQQIGDIFVFKKISKKEAREFMKKFARVKTICARTGKIKGKLRKPQVKVVVSRAKKDKTIAIHLEDGIRYKIDVSKLMFSKGNMTERHRIARLAKPNEIVLDMFAGIGYFSLPLAKKVKKVYSIELNPVSYKYLLENIKLNKLNNIGAIKGDCAEIVPRLKIKADRIMMGYLPSPFKYVSAAFRAARKGAVIHYHCLADRNNAGNEIKKLLGRINKIHKVKLLDSVMVKEFSPGKDHYVLDLKVI